jgi:hypothetical protein
MNIRPMGAELFHENGRVDRHDEAYSRIPNSAISPNNCTLLVPDDVHIFCLDCNIHI